MVSELRIPKNSLATESQMQNLELGNYVIMIEKRGVANESFWNIYKSGEYSDWY